MIRRWSGLIFLLSIGGIAAGSSLAASNQWWLLLGFASSIGAGLAFAANGSQQ